MISRTCCFSVVFTVFLLFDVVRCLVPTNRSKACVAPFNRFQFCNTSLPTHDRVMDLIQHINATDKPKLLTARGWPQGSLTGLPYIGVPPFDWGLNCVHGVESTCVGDVCPTSFPNPNALGATWNSSNVLAMGNIMGVELRALWLAEAREPSLWSGYPKIGLDCWSPNININRDPRWGRNQEVPSEDPLLSEDYVVGYTVGIQQGDDDRYLQAVATIKHFAAYSLEDSDGFTRYDFNAVISQYDAYDTYFPVFYASVAKSNAAGFMCSYNAVNGTPSCASSLLRSKLRNDWKFDGYVTSDTDAIYCIQANHHYTKTLPEASCVALKDGETDINSGGTYDGNLLQGVENGFCSMKDVDRALYNSFKVRFRLGLFDPVEDQPYWNVPISSVHTPQSQAQSLFSALQSMVLLDNKNNALPLQISPGMKIALLGPSANSTNQLLGNYLGWVCPDQSFHCVDTILSRMLKIDAHVSYSMGCSIEQNSTSGFDAAIALANSSDVVIFVGGLSQEVESESHDRVYTSLPAIQSQLLMKLRGAIGPSKPIILVLLNGGSVSIEVELPLVNAVLEAWYPGMYGADAIVQTLLGINNPGGKLPVTVYYSNYTTQIKMSDMDMTTGVGRGYRYTRVPVLFHFGFGLSYTLFQLFNPLAVFNTLGPAIDVSCLVKNVGSVSGDEVVEVFMQPPVAQDKSPQPIKVLVGYQRVSTLVPGAEKAVTLPISISKFCSATISGSKTLLGGLYVVWFSNGNDQVYRLSIMIPVNGSSYCDAI